MPEGRHVLLRVNVGTEASPNWVPVGKQNALDISRTRETTREPHKDSALGDLSVGNKSGTITLAGLQVPFDEGYRALERAYDSGLQSVVQVVDSGVLSREFFGLVSQFNESHPVGGKSTYNVTFEFTEEVSHL